MIVLRSITLFLLAGLCEIGGGYLVWLWLREGRELWVALIGGVVLVLYGVVATWQPADFGRVYAAYGGVFITLSVLWGWLVDKKSPDRFELMGAFVALIGAGIIMYWPRR
ncbi:MAG: YnfA family protein [Chloroflexota bacterium]